MAVERLRLLASYGVKNSLEWIMRDWMQNFIDSASAMGIENPFDEISVTFQKNQMIISGPGFFDFNYLLYIGATSKAGKAGQIGEKGEGLKITSLIAMRDYNLDIQYSSFGKDSGWIATGFFDNVTINGSEEKELCFQVNPDSSKYSTPTSFVSVMGSEEVIATLESMNYMDWFSHNDNKFLSSPITDKIYNLPEGEKHGRLFLAGIDRGEDERLSFVYRLDEKIEGDNDRDRKTLSDVALRQAIKKCLEDPNLPKQVYEKIIKSKEESVIGHWSYDAEAVGIRSNENFLSFFNDTYDGNLSSFTFSENVYQIADKNILKRLGVNQATYYDLANFLNHRHVKSIETLLDGLRSTQEKKAEMPELRKIGVLYDVIRSAGLKALPVKLFKPDNEEDARIDGTYNTTFVRLNERVLSYSFGKALSIYVHELSHYAGSDESAAFSDALTTMMGQALGSSLDAEDATEHFKVLASANRRWNSFKKKA